MKALHSYRSGTKGFDILHTDVVEIPRRTANREFMCRHCGLTWTENINSPQILSEKVENNLSNYYQNYTECESK